MIYDKERDSYACPETFDNAGNPRPTKGHLFFVPSEVLDDPRAFAAVMGAQGC